MKKIKVLVDTSPLDNAHAHRGIGMYTKLLVEHLRQEPAVKVIHSSQADPGIVKPDVVHYPYFDLFFNTLPFFHLAPAVVTIHDVIPLKFPKQYRPGVKGRVRLQRQKLALKKIRAIITDSEASKQDISDKLGVEANKIHVIYLAANPNLVKANDETVAHVRHAYKLPRKYILYVGDINYNKNLPQLVKALKYLPEDLHLVLVGRNFVPQEIPEWQWIDTQIALSNVANRVHFVTDLPVEQTNDLAGLYTGAIAYVQPSLAEGFGLPVLEAMQCRTPVVSTRNSSLIEVGGEQVLYAEPEAEALADQIKSILEWPLSKREEWLLDAYKWSQTFSWIKTARETIKVYESIL